MAREDPEISAFYRESQSRPLWIEQSRLGRHADVFLELLASAQADGLDPSHYQTPALVASVEVARESGSAQALAQAEIELTKAFAAYVRDARTVRDIGIVYGEPALRPAALGTLAILGAAGAALSFPEYVRTMGWMHPTYSGLRRAIADVGSGSVPEGELHRLKVNLERARALPVNIGTYILVDAAAARLTYIEDGKARESMRVVIGTPDNATPMMVGMLRYATLNPYWHVPPDLTRERIAPRVLSEGLSYFRSRGYEVVDEWSSSGKIIDPATVDWRAVAAGRVDILVRQKPGPNNGMGKAKFQFPNDLGIYLHDTPAKHLFELDERSASAGCVRLEDADKLARILLPDGAVVASGEPEQTVHLPRPVPVYITYLTAAPVNGRIVHRKDIYGWDTAQLAAATDVGRSGPLTP